LRVAGPGRGRAGGRRRPTPAGDARHTGCWAR